MTWPPVLVDMEMLHRKWLASADRDLDMEPYHPNLVGFGSSLNALRSSQSDAIESSVRIMLPVFVQTHIEGKYNLAWSEINVRVVFLDFKAYVESYAKVMDNDEFEMVQKNKTFVFIYCSFLRQF